MQLESYLIIRDNFADLPLSDLYQQALDHIRSMGGKDINRDFQDIHPLRLTHILDHFIFQLNLIVKGNKFDKKFAYFLITNDNEFSFPDKSMNTSDTYSQVESVQLFRY